MSSYEHNHRQRLIDMKKMQKDPQAAEKARKAEKKADKAGLISVKIGGVKEEPVKKKTGGGFKTVFKSAAAAVDEEKEKEVKIPGLGLPALQPAPAIEGEEEHEPQMDVSMNWQKRLRSDDDYDPYRPTTCGPDCACPISQARMKSRAEGDESGFRKFLIAPAFPGSIYEV
jgi:hypothetical protein